MLGQRDIYRNVSGQCNHCHTPFYLTMMVAIDGGKKEGEQVLLPILPIFCNGCLRPMTVIYVRDPEVLRAYSYRWN